MKVASVIVALALALAPGAPARTAPLAGEIGPMVHSTVAGAADTTTSARHGNDAAQQSAAPGPSSYLLLALALFGMGLVSRRRAN